MNEFNLVDTLTLIMSVLIFIVLVLIGVDVKEIKEFLK